MLHSKIKDSHEIAILNGRFKFLKFLDEMTSGSMGRYSDLDELYLFMQSVELSLFTIDKNGSLISFMSKLWEKDSEMIAK